MRVTSSPEPTYQRLTHGERRSARSRLLGWRPPGGLLGPIYLACLAAVLLSSALLTYISTRSHLAAVVRAQYQVAHTLSISAAELAQNWAGVDPSFPSTAGKRALDNLAAEGGVLRLELVRSDGQLVYASGGAQTSLLPLALADRAALAAGHTVQRYWEYSGDIRSGRTAEALGLLQTFQPGSLALQVLGPVGNLTGVRPVFVNVVIDLDPVKARMQKVVIYSAASIFGSSLLLSVILGVMLGVFVQRPLRQLQQAAERFARGDRRARVRAGRSDELGRLARAFNAMALHVDEATAVLEQRVSERTAELNAANRALNTALTEAQQRADELAAMGIVRHALGATLDTMAIFEELYRQTAWLMPAHAFFVGLLEEDGTTLTLSFMVEGQQRGRPAASRQIGPVVHEVIKRDHPTIFDTAEAYEAAGGVRISNTAISQSFIFAPIRLEGQTFGLLSVQSQSPHAYTQRHARLLAEVALQAAQAIRNARLYETERRRSRQLDSLAQTARLLGSTLEQPEAVRNATPIICAHLDASSAFITLMEQRRHATRLLASHGVELAGFDVASYAFDGGPTSWIIRHKQSLRADDLGQDARFTAPPEGHPLGVARASYLGAPLVVDDRVLGTLEVLDARGRPFSSEDLSFVEAQAGQIAAALSSASLYAQTRKRAARLQVLNQIGRRLSATLKLAELYPMVHMQCQRVLPVDAFYVALYDEGAATIAFPYCYDQGVVELNDVLPLGHGPTSHVIRTRQPYLVTATDDPIQRLGDAFGNVDRPSGSAIHVPLLAGNRVIGALSAQSYGTADYDYEDVAVLVTIASQTAVTMENIHLYTEVQNRERRLAEIVEATPDMMIVVDADRKLMLMNDAGERLLGYGPSELVGHPLEDLFPPDLSGDLQAVLRQIESEDLVRDWETFACARNSERVPVSVSVGALRASEGRVEGIVAVARDLRDRRRLEQQLVQAERLSAVGGLVAGVAHELNNPLTTVLGFSELLLRADLDPELARDAHYIHQAAERCKRIVADLLSFARAPKSTRVPEDLNRLVQRVLALMGYVVRGAGVAIELDLDPALHFVALDAHQIQQVLFNLLQNALQAMDGQANPRWIKVSTTRRGSVVQLRVADNGPGIAPDNLHRLFEPFFSTKDVGQGTGLGLSLAYSAVREHGGTIHVRNIPGAGAEFIVELPFVDQVAPDEQPEAKQIVADLDPARRHILVVDDEDAVRKLLDATLSELGFQVDVAADGVGALRLLERHEFAYDVVLADLRMPGLGGAELYQHIAEKSPSLGRRVVFITGDTVSSDTRAFLERTGLQTVAKPFRASDLQHALAHAIKGSGEREPSAPDSRAAET